MHEVGKNLGEYSTNLDFPEVPVRGFPTQIRAAALIWLEDWETGSPNTVFGCLLSTWFTWP